VQEIKERFVLDEDQVGVVHAVRGFEIFHGFVFVAREGDDRSDKLRLEVLLAGESLNVFRAPALNGGLSAGNPSPVGSNFGGGIVPQVEPALVFGLGFLVHPFEPVEFPQIQGDVRVAGAGETLQAQLFEGGVISMHVHIKKA